WADKARLGQAGLAPAAALLMVGARAPRPVRVLCRALVWALAAVLAFVYVDRALRYGAFQARFADYDGFVKRYVGAQWLEDLTVPGDTIVVMPYGGLQYLTARRESGIGARFLLSAAEVFPAA